MLGAFVDVTVDVTVVDVTVDDIRRIVTVAPAHLAAGGQLWLEHGYDQAEAVCGLLEAAGLADIEQHRDLAGTVRVSGGRLRR